MTLAAFLSFPQASHALYISEKRGYHSVDFRIVEEGMSKEEVRNIIGGPSFISTFYENEDKWYYHRYTRKSMTFLGKENADYQLLALTFSSNDKVIEMEIIPVDPRNHKTVGRFDGDRKMDYGKKLSFIDQLIGNLRKIARDGLKR